MKDRTIGFGIIGCGTIANLHAKAIGLANGARLIGIVGSKRENGVSFAALYDVKPFDTIEEMLSNKEVDVVCICTPSGLHAVQAKQALLVGKHVLIEKPMALTLSEADEIAALCAENRVKCGVVSQLRFSQAVRAAKKVVDEGRLGRIVTASVDMKFYRSQEYYKNSGWRGTWALDGGGALMNQGIHGIDLLLYLCGGVKTVSAYARTLVREIEVEDTAVAALEFENGALGFIRGTTSVYPGYPRRLEMCGERGSIALEENTIVRWDVEGAELPEVLKTSESVNAAADPAAVGTEGHLLQISDMVEAIKNNRAPLVDALEGRKPLALILAAYESSNTGKQIDLTEFTNRGVNK